MISYKNKKICICTVTYNSAEIFSQFISNYLHLIKFIKADLCVLDNSENKKVIEQNKKAIARLTKKMQVLSKEKLLIIPTMYATNIFYFESDHNCGGAGGFSKTTRFAVKEGYRLLWLLDDDCKFNEKTLSELLYCEANDAANTIYASLTVSKDNSTLSPPVNILKSTSTVPHLNLSPGNCTVAFDTNSLPREEVFHSTGNFFNSILISDTIFKEIGFPNPIFFIWGDENDFLFRCWRSGKVVKIVKKSIVLTNNAENYKRFKILTLQINLPLLSEKKLYYMIRNSYFLNKKYNLVHLPLVRHFLLCLKYLIYEILTSSLQKKLHRVELVIKAFWDGLMLVKTIPRYAL